MTYQKMRYHAAEPIFQVKRALAAAFRVSYTAAGLLLVGSAVTDDRVRAACGVLAAALGRLSHVWYNKIGELGDPYSSALQGLFAPRAGARVITPHVIERLLSRDVELVRKLGADKSCRYRAQASNKDFANGEFPPSSFEPAPDHGLSLDGSLSGQRRGHGGCGYYIACN